MEKQWKIKVTFKENFTLEIMREIEDFFKKIGYNRLDEKKYDDFDYYVAKTYFVMDIYNGLMLIDKKFLKKFNEINKKGYINKIESTDLSYLDML